MSLCKGKIYALPAHEIHKQCFEKGWSAKEFQGLLDLPTSRLWMDEESMLLCSHVADQMEILTIGVLPKARQKGKALALLNEMNQYARQHLVQHIFLEVAENNLPAIRLYEKTGFIPMGKRKGYYQKGKVDALTYQKRIKTSP